MSVKDMNNADQIKEKTSSLNAQMINNINNFLQQPQWTDGQKKKIRRNELKKHASIFCEYQFFKERHQTITKPKVHSALTFIAGKRHSVVIMRKIKVLSVTSSEG